MKKILVGTHRKIYFAMVDDKNFRELDQYQWYALVHKNTIYAHRMEKTTRKFILMHRQIMKAPDNIDIDHKDNNGLNNLEENLRFCTVSQNMANSRLNTNGTSMYRGVLWNRNRNNWLARIKTNGKAHYIGSFYSEIEAAKAYDRAAMRIFGEFARVNFPDES